MFDERTLAVDQSAPRQSHTAMDAPEPDPDAAPLPYPALVRGTLLVSRLPLFGAHRLRSMLGVP